MHMWFDYYRRRFVPALMPTQRTLAALIRWQDGNDGVRLFRRQKPLISAYQDNAASCRLADLSAQVKFCWTYFTPFSSLIRRSVPPR